MILKDGDGKENETTSLPPPSRAEAPSRGDNGSRAHVQACVAGNHDDDDDDDDDDDNDNDDDNDDNVNADDDNDVEPVEVGQSAS